MTKEFTRHELALLASNQGEDLLSAGYSLSDLRSAGYSLSDLRSAGYSLSDLLSAGYSASDLRSAGYSLSGLLERTPLVEKPYTRLLADIRAQRRLFSQKTWGPEDASTPEPNICKTAMCTAGHLVSMAGEAGWKLKEEFGFAGAAALIHAKAHPDFPCQNFGVIPDAWALAYIEEMAEHEANVTAIP